MACSIAKCWNCSSWPSHGRFASLGADPDVPLQRHHGQKARRMTQLRLREVYGMFYEYSMNIGCLLISCVHICVYVYISYVYCIQIMLVETVKCVSKYLPRQFHSVRCAHDNKEKQCIKYPYRMKLGKLNIQNHTSVEKGMYCIYIYIHIYIYYKYISRCERCVEGIPHSCNFGNNQAAEGDGFTASSWCNGTIQQRGQPGPVWGIQQWTYMRNPSHFDVYCVKQFANFHWVWTAKKT